MTESTNIQLSLCLTFYSSPPLSLSLSHSCTPLCHLTRPPGYTSGTGGVKTQCHAQAEYCPPTHPHTDYQSIHRRECVHTNTLDTQCSSTMQTMALYFQTNFACNIIIGICLARYWSQSHTQSTHINNESFQSPLLTYIVPEEECAFKNKKYNFFFNQLFVRF